ncbi:UNVERIFIED_CONTAM: hypothetical protein HDU68_000894 [Siphonaria sp. JEL0065]|nr:hypothetical protein HDU68_000894 [Siphonaria sp. JEL0065]
MEKLIQVEFQVASQRGIPIVHPSWINACLALHSRLKVASLSIDDVAEATKQHAIKALSGLRICVTGFDLEQRNRIEGQVKSLGAAFDSDLTRECSHLVALNSTGKKYEFALKNGIKVVGLAWVDEAPEDAFAVGSIQPVVLKKEPTVIQQPTKRSTGAQPPISAATIQKQSTPVMLKPSTIRKLAVSEAAKPLSDCDSPSLLTTSKAAVLQPQQTQQQQFRKSSNPRKSLAINNNTSTPKQKQYPPTGKLSQKQKRKSMISQHFQNRRSSAASLPQNTNMSGFGNGALSSLFDGITFLIQGFDPSDTEILSDEIQCQDGDVVHSIDALRDVLRRAVAARVSKKGCVLCPLGVGPTGDVSGLTVVSECWVERCIEDMTPHDFDAHVLFRGVKYRSTDQQFRIGITGYIDLDREQIRKLVQAMGATFTESLSRSNTHLIAHTEPDGGEPSMKVVRAKEWGVEIVTVDWLFQCADRGELLFPLLEEVEPIVQEARDDDVEEMRDYEVGDAGDVTFAMDVGVGKENTMFDEVEDEPVAARVGKSILDILKEKEDRGQQVESPVALATAALSVAATRNLAPMKPPSPQNSTIPVPQQQQRIRPKQLTPVIPKAPRTPAAPSTLLQPPPTQVQPKFQPGFQMQVSSPLQPLAVTQESPQFEPPPKSAKKNTKSPSCVDCPQPVERRQQQHQQENYPQHKRQPQFVQQQPVHHPQQEQQQDQHQQQPNHQPTEDPHIHHQSPRLTSFINTVSENRNDSIHEFNSEASSRSGYKRDEESIRDSAPPVPPPIQIPQPLPLLVVSNQADEKSEQEQQNRQLQPQQQMDQKDEPHQQQHQPQPSLNNQQPPKREQLRPGKPLFDLSDAFQSVESPTNGTKRNATSNSNLQQNATNKKATSPSSIPLEGLFEKSLQQAHQNLTKQTRPESPSSKQPQPSLVLLKDVRICLSNRAISHRHETIRLCKLLGADFQNTYQEGICTHYVQVSSAATSGGASVSDKEWRKVKADAAEGRVYIVSPKWLEVCFEKGKRVGEEGYPWMGDLSRGLWGTVVEGGEVLNGGGVVRRSESVTSDTKKSEEVVASPLLKAHDPQKVSEIQPELKQPQPQKQVSTEEASSYAAAVEKLISTSIMPLKRTWTKQRTGSFQRTPSFPEEPATAAVPMPMRQSSSTSLLPSDIMQEHDEEAYTQAPPAHYSPVLLDPYATIVTYDDPQARAEKRRLLEQLQGPTPTTSNNPPLVSSIMENQQPALKRAKTAPSAFYEQQQPSSTNSRSFTRIFQLTGIPGKSRASIRGKIMRLGGQVVLDTESDSNERTTHLICSKPVNTDKCYSIIAKGGWMLKEEYIEKSYQEGRFIEEDDYEWATEVGIPNGGAYQTWVVLYVTKNKAKEEGFVKVLRTGLADVTVATIDEVEMLLDRQSFTHCFTDQSADPRIVKVQKQGINVATVVYICDYLVVKH